MKKNNHTILVIDDSVTARITIKNILEGLNCNVELAENGVSAIAIAQTVKPDLILLDLSMPIWDGFSTLAVLKEHADTKAIPIAILSGKEERSDTIRAEALGAINFILKPCSVDDISKTLTLI